MSKRFLNFKCEFCENREFSEEIEFGCYLEFNSGCEVSILRERPKRDDIFVKDVVCPLCGCCSGLKRLPITFK